MSESGRFKGTCGPKAGLGPPLMRKIKRSGGSRRTMERPSKLVPRQLPNVPQASATHRRPQAQTSFIAKPHL